MQTANGVVVGGFGALKERLWLTGAMVSTGWCRQIGGLAESVASELITCRLLGESILGEAVVHGASDMNRLPF